MHSPTPSLPDDHEPASDEAIAERVRDGEVEAFELLVRRHAQRVRDLVARNAGPDLVDDLAQDAFVRAYEALPGFRPTGSFSGWLARIALRVCVDHWRRAPREAAVPLEEAPPAPRTSRDDRELLDRALATLDPSDRDVVRLLYLEGLSVRDCADMLSWSAAKVKVRAHRARARLREVLGRLDPDRGGER